MVPVNSEHSSLSLSSCISAACDRAYPVFLIFNSATFYIKIIVTTHELAESLRQAHYAQVGMDSRPQRGF